MSKILLPMFYSRIFMVSSLIFKSLIHFEFIPVYGVRRWSLFFFCMHLSNIPNIIYWIDYLYPIVYFCLLCQTLIDCKGWVYFWVLYSASLSYDYYGCIVWYQVVRFLQYNFEFSFQTVQKNFVFLSQHCCGYLGSFVVPYQFWNISSSSVNHAISNMTGIVLNL